MKRKKLRKKVKLNPVEWGQPESKYITPSHKSPDTSAATQAEHQQARLWLSEVLRLQPVSWRWKTHPETGHQLGLVAQEVEPVLPELISTAKDAEQMKGLNYVGLLPVLVNAIKEQQQQLVQYRTQLAQQQARDRQQQQELAAIKKLLCRSQPHAALCKAR